MNISADLLQEPSVSLQGTLSPMGTGEEFSHNADHPSPTAVKTIVVWL